VSVIVRGVSKTFGEWYQEKKKKKKRKKEKTERYKQINFIGLQNNRHPSQHTIGNVHKSYGKLSTKASLGIDRRTTVTHSWIAAVCGQ
jgi:hypothetical protein